MEITSRLLAKFRLRPMNIEHFVAREKRQIQIRELSRLEKECDVTNFKLNFELKN